MTNGRESRWVSAPKATKDQFEILGGRNAHKEAVQGEMENASMGQMGYKFFRKDWRHMEGFLVLLNTMLWSALSDGLNQRVLFLLRIPG